ncbi:MAG: cytochrome c oxidase accessory protein CcoG [Alphaproteobacteria bacterium]|nr:cytochrome c oxidase accessory protein CcoG [Alphaproteobacteria bacterium]
MTSTAEDAATERVQSGTQAGTPESYDVEPVNRRDQQQPLYAPKKKIYPKRAEGAYRRLKWIIMAVTLGIYYVTPWIRWDRGEFAPDQAVLIDLMNRRFYFFFIEIWPQEFYYVAGMLVMAGIGLFLVTSSVGRAWCGYTCPQTVWTDLFIWVERLIEGDRNKRMRLDKQPYGPSKIAKRTAKHAIWLLIAVATGGAWIFYFADAPTLFVELFTGEAAVVAYGTVAVLTFTTYTLGGHMREQICIYMCPWPRVQGAMLDENSLTVTYNDWRGEPRSRHQKQAEKEGKIVGDCIDCNACVAVCPTGIDIRDGQQLECITCALCIDACDEMMDKVGRPRGLISYATLNDYNANMRLSQDADGRIDPRRSHAPDGSIAPEAQHTSWRSIIRPRTMIYFAVWALIGLTMVFHVATRDRLDLNILHDRNPRFVVLSDGNVRNGYTVKVLNMMPEPRTVRLTIEGVPGAVITTPGAADDPKDALFLDVDADKLRSQRVFVQTDPAEVAESPATIRFLVQDIFGSESAVYESNFVSTGDR